MPPLNATASRRARYVRRFRSAVRRRLQKRWLANLAETAEEWSASVSTLSRWEDDKLLDNQSPELLADHKATIERLPAFGGSLSLATESRKFPDRRIAEMVAATQVGNLQHRKCAVAPGPERGVRII